MTDKLRDAAQAALEMLNNDDRDCAFAAGILRAALAEPAIKDSLTVQRPWVGLTAEDMADAHNSTSGDVMMRLAGFARVIEAMLREKNT